MKKSLKALFLCALTSLVMFAVVYASPIVAKAATHTISADIIDEDTQVPCGTITVTYDDTQLSSPNVIGGVAGYFTGTNWVAVYLEFGATNISSINSINASYDFTFAGQHFSGTEVLSNSDTNPNSFTTLRILSDMGSDATGYGAQINDLKNHIGNISKDSTLTGENRVVEFNEGTALPKSVISSLANSENVTLKFTFVYEGYEFCTTITSEDAKRVYDSKVEWAGPCYLANNFPTVWTGKTVK